MGTITGNTRRTANIGSSSAGSAGVVKTIYTDNDTIDDQIREVSIYGNTSSDKLIFQNLAGDDILSLQGDKYVYFGTSSVPLVSQRNYMSSAASSEWLYYRDNVQWLNIDAGGYGLYISGVSSSVSLTASGLYGGRVNTTGDYATMYNFKSNGDLRGAWGLENGHGSAFLTTSGGTRNIYMNANDYVAFNRNTSIGKSYNVAPIARLEVIGEGLTPATTTAIFQNNSSVNSLKIRDDNYVIQRAINAAIADADLSNNEMSAYINEATSFLIFKVKISSGVVKTASIALV